MKNLNPSDKKLLADIEEFGWHVLKIMEDEQGPAFCYSVGLYETFNHPEIVIVGLKLELGHILINNIGEDIRNGFTYHSNQFYPDIIDNFDCLMLTVDNNHYEDYFGYAKWFYKTTDIPFLQCIYPTIKGIYPWEDNWPKEIKNLQPLLGSFNKEY